MITWSAVGLVEMTVIWAAGLVVNPLTELVAVTLKLSCSGAVSSGGVGAVKVTLTEPSPFTVCELRVIPAGGVKLKVRLPPAGSTPRAVSVTTVPPVTGFAGDELTVTAGAWPAGGTAIGTTTKPPFGSEAGTVPLPPTINWKVTFCAPVTVGARKVGLPTVGSLRVMTGSPGLMICCQWNGPLGGVLAVPSRVTVIPEYGGFGLDE